MADETRRPTSSAAASPLDAIELAEVERELRSIEACSHPREPESHIQPPLGYNPVNPAPLVAPRVLASDTKDTTMDHTARDADYARRLQLAREAFENSSGLFSIPKWIHLHPLLGSFLAEATGTFVLVMAIALVTGNNPSPPDHPGESIASLPIGFMFMAMVFSFEYISGAHFNPTITLAVAFTRSMNIFRALMYIGVQLGAAFGAGIVAMLVQGADNVVVPNVDMKERNIRVQFFSEFLFSFLLATVVLHLVYSSQPKNTTYGFAVGMASAVGVASIGGVRHGVFNPTISTGLQAALCLADRCGPLAFCWLNWLAAVPAALVAAILFHFMWKPSDADLAAEAL